VRSVTERERIRKAVEDQGEENGIKAAITSNMFQKSLAKQRFYILVTVDPYNVDEINPSVGHVKASEFL